MNLRKFKYAGSMKSAMLASVAVGLVVSFMQLCEVTSYAKKLLRCVAWQSCKLFDSSRGRETCGRHPRRIRRPQPSTTPNYTHSHRVHDAQQLLAEENLDTCFESCAALNARAL